MSDMVRQRQGRYPDRTSHTLASRKAAQINMRPSNGVRDIITAWLLVGVLVLCLFVISELQSGTGILEAANEPDRRIAVDLPCARR